ncbi:MAG: hypothetical protein WCI67_09065 [Chloroflexales bacterium]
MRQPSVAAFWIAMGGALGVYPFARAASLPLLAILQWLFLAILTPLGVYAHLQFPLRPVPRDVSRRARRALVATWVGVTAIYAGALALWHPTLPELVTVTARLLPLAFVVAFVSSGGLLAGAYRRTPVAHVRRQIRLIAAASLVVGTVWLALLVIPALTDQLPPIAGAWLDLLAGLIPLAYLVSGVLPSLYHLDQVVRRVGTMVTTVGALAALLLLPARLLPAGWATTAGLIGVCVIGYAPLAALVGRVFADRDRSYAPLHAAAHALTYVYPSGREAQQL